MADIPNDGVSIGQTVKGYFADSLPFDRSSVGNFRTPEQLTAQDVFHVGVNYSKELKAILITNLYVARNNGDSLSLLLETVPQEAIKAYRNNSQFHNLVDHTLEEIIAVLAIRRMTE